MNGSSSERTEGEQAALRRVATLVARATPPEDVFAAVATEVGRLLDVDFTFLNRYDTDMMATVVGSWSTAEAGPPIAVGTRYELSGRNAPTLVFQTAKPARIDDYDVTWGAVTGRIRELGIHSAIAVPISVNGQLWGGISAASSAEEPLPGDTEARLAGFTELVATAIANSQARVELRGYAAEQAALRRIATLVARAAAPEEIFAAVAAEVGRLTGADFTVLSRYDPDGAAIVAAGWVRTTADRSVEVGTRLRPSEQHLHWQVFRTGRPVRVGDYRDVTGPRADLAKSLGLRSGVGVPISVDGRLWGAICVASTGDEPLGSDTEARLTGFTELVATALANTEAHAALTASRARIVSSADQARRRIERDLHDGAQQRLVALALQLRTAQLAVPPGASDLSAQLDEVVDGLTATLDELREIVRGIHPAVLAEGGLGPALKALARRSAVPVRLDIRTQQRFPEAIEIAAYYAVSEALTNAAKHANATVADVEVTAEDGMLHVSIEDNGCGGADPDRGSGLVGLIDRVEALSGRLWLHSAPDSGTTVQLALPVAGPDPG
ncbi:MAG TPA: GAF domain-containing sensor histidine kinase [Pseudonocardiaceae bacterium]